MNPNYKEELSMLLDANLVFWSTATSVSRCRSRATGPI